MTVARRVVARDQLPRTDIRRTGSERAETETGTAEGIRRSTPGKSALVKLLAA